MKKGVILCLSVVLMLTPLARVVASISTSDVDKQSIASKFLLQVAGFNASYDITLSTPSGPFTMSSTHVIPHFVTHVSGTISDEYGESDAVFSFIDGDFWSYDSHLLHGNLTACFKEESFNDSLNALIRVANGCWSLFNASYWSDFVRLASTALQTQRLSTENENFLLEIQNDSSLSAICYAKIDGQYTSPFRSTQIYMAGTGLVNAVVDSMRIYHVATTNVTVSKDQAIAFAEPYIEAFAQKNQQNVTAMKAAFQYSTDQREQRGDSFALYPMWSIHATYDKIGEYNASSYTVLLWADNGIVSMEGPDAFYSSTPNSNALANLPLLLAPPVIIIFVLASGAYLHRKPKLRRK